MAAKEGMRRIVKAISVIAWAVFAAAFVLSIGILFGREKDLFFVALGFGAATFVLLQGLAWILVGFSGNQKESDGLVRWADLWGWRRRRAPQTSFDVGPVGVGGWLLWLSISLLIFAPLVIVSSTFNDIQSSERLYPMIAGLDSWLSFKITYWGIALFSCAISVTAGYQLHKILAPSSVKFAIMALWVISPVRIIATLISGYVFFGEDGGTAMIGDIIGPLMGSIIGAAIWTFYLRLSRRVRNTYYHRLYPTYGTMSVPKDRQEPTL